MEGARIKTLPVILIPVAMSSAWAFNQTGLFKKHIFFFTALSALFIQIAVNFFNDALDSKEGIDNSLRKGPSRLVQNKRLSFFQVRFLGFLSCGLAVFFGIPLIRTGGWPILILGLLSCSLAYFYTGTRFSLLKTGLSEIFCFLFFGPIAIFGTYYLQTLTLDISLIYLGIPCGFWALSILFINHLRDEEEDRQGGRKHFVILYGRTHTLLFLAALQAFIYLFCFFWLGQGLKSGAWEFFCSASLSSSSLFYLHYPPLSKIQCVSGFLLFTLYFVWSALDRRIVISYETAALCLTDKLSNYD